MPFAHELTTIGGVPDHPLLADAVAVLLPLAALCSVGIALHGRLRRRFGWPVLALTAVAVIAVPLAQESGRQLLAELAARGIVDPLVARHVTVGEQLLPYALGFGVTVVVLFVAGRLADRERAASRRGNGNGTSNGTSNGTGEPADASNAVPKTWRRIAVLASALVLGTAGMTTVAVVRIGTTGAQSVWQQISR